MITGDYINLKESVEEMGAVPHKVFLHKHQGLEFDTGVYSWPVEGDEEVIFGVVKNKALCSL